jgi:amidase
MVGWMQRHAIANAWEGFLARYPLLLGPVSTMQPFPVGYDLAGQEQMYDILTAHRLIVTANLLGLPAAVVPVDVANGLPQGVQIIGARYREDLCLDAAEAIESRAGTLTPIDPR